MKVGWLWWQHDAEDDPILVADEPNYGFKWVQIVYAEVVK